MVVFTCQHCNASLKKPVVEKHYLTKCRRNPYLTCVDCLKDFYGDEYVSHTSCVSEDQRYGGTGYVAKPVAVKQNNWLGIAQQCINNNTNPKYTAIFKRLANSPNLPRKKSKFVNFMSNAMNMKNTALSEEIFEVFQQEFERANKKSVNENKTENNSKATNGSAKIDVSQESSDNKTVKNKNLPTSESNVQEESLTNGNTKKKSKKRKTLDNANSKDPLEEVDQVSNDNVNPDDTKMENGSEKKKKKKNKGSKENFDESLIEKETENSPATNIEISAETQETEGTEKMSKKELKKLKKKQKYEAELKQIEVEKALESNSENITEVPSEPQMEVSKSKKKKRKINVSESEPEQKKKKKMEEPILDEIESHVNEEEAEEPKRLGKFDWGEVIKEVLRSSSDQELSVKRLSKKVLAEYQSVKGERESFEELMSKFKKKLNKISGVRLLKDKAKLLPEI